MIAVIQFRTDASKQHEQSCFDKYLPDADLKYLSIFSDDISFDEPEELLASYDKVVLAGSGELLLSRGDSETEKVYEKIRPLMEYVLRTDFPTLGVCFGHQLLGKTLSGEVKNDKSQAEAGLQQVYFNEEGLKDSIFKNINSPISAAMGHEDSVTSLPKNVVLLAHSDKCPIQAFRHGNNVYGVQFHVELDQNDLAERLKMYAQYEQYQLGYDATHGINGSRVLRNFAAL